MSYDVYLVIDTGGAEPVSVTNSRNYTYNCSPMFRHAFGGDGLHNIDGKTGAHACPLLEAAVSNMRSSPDFYRTMNPPNGWGKYETALKFLENIAADCRDHPKATVRIS